MGVQELAGINRNKEPIRIEHHSLNPCGRPNQFRSDCPACGQGVLMVRRDNVTFQLQELDMCMLCGQRVIYTDIDKLRERDGL